MAADVPTTNNNHCPVERQLETLQPHMIKGKNSDRTEGVTVRLPPRLESRRLERWQNSRTWRQTHEGIESLKEWCGDA